MKKGVSTLPLGKGQGNGKVRESRFVLGFLGRKRGSRANLGRPAPVQKKGKKGGVFIELRSERRVGREGLGKEVLRGPGWKG